MKGKVNCTCGWSWNKSDSSAKDMYICHECGRDNSNNMKNGGWLDNYGTQANYNDSKATASPDMRGDGYSNVGRNYSPAWGGQFEDGGKIPQAQKGKKVKPIYVESINDPRYKAFKDSLILSTKGDEWFNNEFRKKDGHPLLPQERVTNALKNKPIGKKKIINDIGEVKKHEVHTINGKKVSDKIIDTKKNQSFHYKNIYAAPQQQVIVKKQEERKPIQEIENNLQPIGIQNDFNIEADIPQIRQQVRQPKYYDIQENINQPFGGSQTNYRTSDLNSITSPDDLGPGNIRKIIPHYQKGGKLKFLQPTSDKLPEGYRIPYDTPSTERASSIGGTNGEPAYLVPEFKYGQPIYDSIEEFKRTGEHLGGPFKTWQEAEEWENTVRHPAVENRETIMFPQEKFQTGGSLPGSVGFTYARTKGIPSNGPYAKKTLASAQNGVDMYDNPIIAKENYIKGAGRSNYKPRTNISNLYDLDPRYNNTRAHENYHARQFAEGRSNFDIGHNTENALWAAMQKRPEITSTEEVFDSYHNRKQKEMEMDRPDMVNIVPETRFMPSRLIDKYIDRNGLQYRNPNSMEGEAEYYGDLGEEYYKIPKGQNGMEMKYYQNGLDFKPKSISRDGGWLNKYDVAQNGYTTEDKPKLGAGKYYTTTNDIVDWGTPEYEKAYNRGEVISEDGVRSEVTLEGGVLPEVVLQNNYKRGFWEKYRDKIIEENRGAGPLGAAVGVPISAVFSLPQLAMMKTFTGEMQRPSEAMDIENPYGAFAVDAVTDPTNLIGAGILTKENALARIAASKETGLLSKFKPKQNYTLPEYMSLEAPKGNMYGENQVLTQQQRLLHPDIKAKFFENQAPEFTPSQPKNSLLNFEKTPKDFGNRITSNNYEDFVNRVHGSTDYDFAASASKKPENLGIGNYDMPGKVFKDAPLNDLGKDIINAHEKNHGIFAGTLSKEMQESLLKPFGTKHAVPHYAGKHQADEVLARMAQFKNAVGIGDNQTFTLGHLNLIRKNYANSFLDNSITEMLDKIKPGSAGEKEFLKNMNKYAFGTGTLVTAGALEQQREGGVIKDDRGQWEHPGEITEINSNDITMQGVPYDVLGISDTGDTKLMKPGKDYKFKGKKVTEFPMAKNGRRQEQKGLQNLEDLTNFTNYSKPTNWLNKYN